jgi:hypothetical protein
LNGLSLDFTRRLLDETSVFLLKGWACTFHMHPAL